MANASRHLRKRDRIRRSPYSLRSYIPPGYTRSGSRARTRASQRCVLHQTTNRGRGKPSGRSAPSRRTGSVQDLAVAGLIPGFPGKHVLPWVWYPRAPLLPEAEDPAADADLLWRAFESVARHRGARAFARGWNRGDRAKAGRGAAIENLTSVPEAALRLAASAMRDHDVEPVAWAWWSWEVWDRGAAARGRRAGWPPPLRWLFDAARVHERSGWFRSETAGKFRIVRHAPWPRVVRDLWLRYQGLVERVRGRHHVDDAELVRAEAGRAFPDGWATHLARAVKALDAQAAEVREALASGVFLW